MKRPFFLALSAAIAVTSTMLLNPGIGRADLTIMPLRVVFDERDRTMDMTLANSTNKSNTYRMEWSFNKMTESGGYEKLEAPLNPNFDFSKNVVFTPRQVTLPPGSRQSIRLSLRRPPDLPEGEYRAHLNFRRLANSRAERGPGQGVGARIGVNVGFSVPVIVRVGAYDAQASISDVQLLPPAKPGQNNRISLNLNRTGKHSIAGRVLVLWTPPGGQEEQIGILNNVNVFTEINRRNINIMLTNSQPLTGGTLRVVYEGIDDERGLKFDEKILPIQ